MRTDTCVICGQNHSQGLCRDEALEPANENTPWDEKAWRREYMREYMRRRRERQRKEARDRPKALFTRYRRDEPIERALALVWSDP